MENTKITMTLFFILVGSTFLAACSSSGTIFPTSTLTSMVEARETRLPDTEVPVVIETLTPQAQGDTEYEILTLLPKDAIQSIDDPQFYSVTEADEEYFPDEFVIGVVFDGQARAYSVPLLSRREIVNDTINSKPIAITW
jgi:hypothetical protein